MTGSKRLAGFINHSPDLVSQLEIFNILGDIIQPAKKVERVAERGESRKPEAGSYAKPGLLSQLDDHAIRRILKHHAQGSLPARSPLVRCCDLDRDLRAVANLLHPQVSSIEMCNQALGKVLCCDFSVVNPPLHKFDYNRNSEKSRKLFQEKSCPIAGSGR